MPVPGFKYARLNLIHFVLLFIFGFSSCGIDTIAYLLEKPIVEDESTLIFKGPIIQDENYYGIFIFYKIYAVEADASSDYSSLVAKQNIENSVPGSNIESFLISPSGLDYQQLVVDNILSIPTLDKKDLTVSNLANLNFSSESNILPTLIIMDKPSKTIIKELELRRNEISLNGLYLSFLDEPQLGNQDYKSNTNDENQNEYHIQFFAVAYGLDLSDLKDLYGEAVYLGRVKQYF